jgi:predicted RNA-binding protein with PUA-like domain
VARAKRHWLFKSEADVFSIDDLAAAEDRTTFWDGVRNYQARNLMRDEIRKGDLVLYYHSNSKPTGVAGVARVVANAHPDPTQFDPRSPYHDPKSPRDAPRWLGVDVAFVRKLPRVIALSELKANPALAAMMVTQRGARLSVQPVTRAEYDAVLAMV